VGIGSWPQPRHHQQVSRWGINCCEFLRLHTTAGLPLSLDVYNPSEFLLPNPSHHDDWLDLESDSAFQAALPRFEAIWTQIAARFADYDDRLAFEVYNEPHVMSVDSLNAMNAAVHTIVRANNPDRTIILGGLQWMDYRWIAYYPNGMTVDFTKADGSKDTNLMVEIHNYDPSDFTWNAGQTSWGTDSDYEAMEYIFSFMSGWSQDHGNINVVLGEFGCVIEQENTEARQAWFDAMFAYALQYDVAAVIWAEDYDYNVYDEATGKFDPQVIAAMPDYN